MEENDMNLPNSNGTQTQTQTQKPPDARRNLRRSYKELLVTTSEYEEQDLKEVDMTKFGKTIKKAHKLFSQVENPQDALLDAKVFKQITRLSKNFVGQLQTSDTKFLPNEFATALDNYFHRTIPLNIANKSPQQIEQGIFSQYFIALGEKIQDYLAKPSYLNYMLGGVEKDEIPDIPETKPKERKSRKSLGDGIGASTQAITDDGKNEVNLPETGASLTELLVESTMTQLREQFLINDRDPIPYFEFILDPTSYGKSVENMFHVSFLIKEGRAKMIVDHERDGLPMIHPNTDKRSGNDEQNLDDKNQAILGLTMEDWEELIEIFSIEKQMIHHDMEKISNRKGKGGKGKRSKYEED